MINYLSLLLPQRQAQWAIGIYTGQTPFALTAHPALGARPALTRQSLEALQADGVADPFLVKHDGRWLMFFEIENRLSGKGEIGLASSDDAVSWRFERVVLDEPFHLSYPIVFESDGSYYMLPESAASGGVRLYRASAFPHRGQLHAEILRGDFYDATVFRHADKWWLMALQGFRRQDALVIYHADDLKGPWHPHAGNPILSGNRQASRPAGRMIVHDGKLVRFAQDFEGDYGRMVRAFVVDELTEHSYAEHPFDNDSAVVLRPGPHRWNASGMHHIDARQIGPSQWLACVDGRRTVWRVPLFTRLAARKARRTTSAASPRCDPIATAPAPTPPSAQAIEGLVSTIIPVFNRPSLLRKAVESVLQQDYRPIEIVIVDDGSTDGETFRVARELEQAHPGIVMSVTQPNGGPGLARERGRQLARGEFIQYLDSDDRLLPGKFKAQVAGLRDDLRAGISYGLTLEEDTRGSSQAVSHRTDEAHTTIFPHVLKSRLWPTLSPLYRKSVCDAIGPWSGQRILEDLDYECRAGLLGIRLHYCPQAVAVIGEHDGERAGVSWRQDPRAMMDRVKGYLKTIDFARQAGIDRSSPDMQHLIRSVFWMARETGALGWFAEADALFKAARNNAQHPGMEYAIFGAAVRMLGWERAGRLARWVEARR